MKKFLLFACVLVVATATFAQSRMANVPIERFIKKAINTSATVPVVTPSNSAAAPITIWSDDFSNAGNWVIDHDATACDLDWQIGINSCQGSYQIDDILSTTASNGYALVDSDFYGGATGGTEVEDSWLTMANPVDLNGYPYVVVEFETQYRSYNNERCYIVVGIADTVTGIVEWPELDPTTNTSTMTNVFDPFPGYGSGDETTNFQLMSVNISSALVGLTSTELAGIYIRFHWTGTWGYAWFVDDVSIAEVPDNGVAIQNEVYGGWWVNYLTAGGLGQNYTYYPMAQATANPYSFEAVIRNTGLATQEVTMYADVSGPSTSSHFSNTISLAMTEQDTFVASPTFTPTTNGVYTIDMWGEADSAGLGALITLTDVATKTTEVTDYTYGKDENSYDFAWRLSRTTGNNPSGIPGGFEVGADYDIYANADLYSVDVFLADYSIPGTNVYVSLYEIDADPQLDPIPLAASDNYTLQAGDPGTWINIPFLSTQSLTQGTEFCISIGSYVHPTDSAGVGVSGNGNASLDRLFDKDDHFQNGAPTWYTIGDIPMLRMNFDPATAWAPSSINEVKTIFNVYPNPTNGVFTIELDNNAKYDVSVHNVLGQTVYSSTINTMSTTVDLSLFDKGIYTIELKDNNTTYTEKVIVE
jgi:hypothetical protein